MIGSRAAAKIVHLRECRAGNAGGEKEVRVGCDAGGRRRVRRIVMRMADGGSMEMRGRSGRDVRGRLLGELAPAWAAEAHGDDEER